MSLTLSKIVSKGMQNGRPKVVGFGNRPKNQKKKKFFIAGQIIGEVGKGTPGE